MGRANTRMRVAGWEKLLVDYISSPPSFMLGESDCVHWCAEWVTLCTGMVLPCHKGEYESISGANKLIKSMGFDSLSHMVGHYLLRKDVRECQRGDLLLGPVDGALGICAGINGVFICENGVVMHKTLDCQRAWGVE